VHAHFIGYFRLQFANFLSYVVDLARKVHHFIKLGFALLLNIVHLLVSHFFLPVQTVIPLLLQQELPHAVVDELICAGGLRRKHEF
jgi:hypothetical protein